MFQQIPVPSDTAADANPHSDLPLVSGISIEIPEPAAGESPEPIVTDRPLPFGVYRGDLRQETSEVSKTSEV